MMKIMTSTVESPPSVRMAGAAAVDAGKPEQGLVRTLTRLYGCSVFETQHLKVPSPKGSPWGRHCQCRQIPSPQGGPLWGRHVSAANSEKYPPCAASRIGWAGA